VKYLLDTNICIYIINERSQDVRVRFEKEVIGDVGISAVTASELAYRVAKTGSARNRAALERFTLPLEIAPYGPQAAAEYGELRARLERRGEVIGPLDMLIAAHAIALGATLVTNNTGEFRRVSRLRCENWIR